MADRWCDRCGAKASPHIPRRKVGDQMLCAMCAQNHGRTAMHPAVAARAGHLMALAQAGLSPDEIVRFELTGSSPRARYLPDGRLAVASRLGNGRICRVAHDSGDGETIFHCPFCGSGQVIARNDGSTECEFCTTAFTVQVQPQMPSFPQTIDGVPVDVPGMPAGGASANVPPGAAPGADPNDPSADPDADGGNPFGGDSGADGDDADDDSDGGDDKPAFLKGSFRTFRGKRLDGEQFMRHLAVRHSRNPNRVLAQIQHENGAR